MKQIIRVMILVLGLTALTATIAEANETPETIAKDHVRIESAQSVGLNSIGLKVIQELAAAIPTVKSYFLLSWKNLGRKDELVVDSYNRIHHFGRWVNDKRDQGCQNTRAKVLVRDSKVPVVFKSNSECTVESGQWNDPYTKTVLTDAVSEVQVDHLVPLKNAYISGAHAWDYQTRCLYANYLGSNYHLKPIDAPENMKKSDGTPARYMPANKEYRCTYIKNWLLVKMVWNLEMTHKEATAIKEIIAEENCNPQQFQITQGEITEQQKFFKNNLALCPKTPPVE